MNEKVQNLVIGTLKMPTEMRALRLCIIISVAFKGVLILLSTLFARRHSLR